MLLQAFRLFPGFFSKDEILAAAELHNPILYWIGVAGALMTAFYMFRLYAGTFLGSFRGTHEQEHHLHESPLAITVPLMVLAFLAVVGGFIGIPEVFAKDAHWLEHFLAPVFAQSKALQPDAYRRYDARTGDDGYCNRIDNCHDSLGLAQIQQLSANNRRESGMGKVLENKWYVDEAYNSAIVQPVNSFGGFLKNVVEKSGIDGLVNGTGRFVQYAARQMRLLQSGQVGNYILFMVLSIVVLFSIFWYQGQIVEFIQKIF